MADHLGRKFGLRGAWSGNTLQFERPGVTGSLAVGDQDVRLSVSLGLLFKAMKGSIEQAVEQEMDEIFAKPPAQARPKARPSPKKSR